MKASELRAKSSDELKQELDSLFREQFNLRMQKGSGEKTQANGFKAVRRNIARVKTVLREKSREDKHE